MPIDKYVEEAARRAQKAGKATLVFRVEAHPEDKEFSTGPPLVDLYVLPKEAYPEVPAILPSECFKGTISADTEKEDRQFQETVESINGMLSRTWSNLWNKGKGKKREREPRAFWIIAEPSGAWKERYERTTESRTLSTTGSSIPLVVSLRPKLQQGRQSNSSQNDRGHLKL